MKEDSKKGGEKADDRPEEGGDAAKEGLEGILIHGKRWIRGRAVRGVRVCIWARVHEDCVKKETERCDADDASSRDDRYANSLSPTPSKHISPTPFTSSLPLPPSPFPPELSSSYRKELPAIAVG